MKMYAGVDPHVLDLSSSEVSGQLHTLATLPSEYRALGTHWIGGQVASELV
jgi:hypothetical protein